MREDKRRGGVARWSSIPGALTGVLWLSLTQLSGCASVSVPVDSFYRLPAVSETQSGVSGAAAASGPGARWADGVVVERFQANALYLDRAIVFSEHPQGLRLERYQYHHWLDAPTDLLPAHLTAFLESQQVATVVVTDASPLAASIDSPARIKGAIHAVDHMISSSGSHVQVEIELSVQLPEQPNEWLRFAYRELEPVGGERVSDAVLAFGRALERSYRRLVRDVQAARGAA